MDASISPAALRQALGSTHPPLVIDVRRRDRFLESPVMVKGALRRDPEAIEAWKDALPRAEQVVVYCIHGHEVSQTAARVLGASYLEGGIESWTAAGGALDAKPAGSAMRWITRERPKIDRIACPWLVRRFIDASAEFLYVPASSVTAAAVEHDAIPYDVPGVAFSHEGERCSFDAFLRHYRLEQDPALQQLAVIVRGADTARLDLAPEAAGLAAISLGLSRLSADDHATLESGMPIYDALYAWSKGDKGEVHTWNPAACR